MIWDAYYGDYDEMSLLNVKVFEIKLFRMEKIPPTGPMLMFPANEGTFFLPSESPTICEGREIMIVNAIIGIIFTNILEMKI